MICLWSKERKLPVRLLTVSFFQYLELFIAGEKQKKKKKKWCYKMRDEKGNCWGTTLFIFRLCFTLFLGSPGF